MKITLKTLKQQTFIVEVDVEKDTVRTLKEKLYTESNLAYPVDRQRLIYLGKIMEDYHLLSQYKLDDKKFIVVMSKKPTPAADEQQGEGDGSDAKKQETPVPKQPEGKTDASATGTGGDGTDPSSSSSTNTNKPSTSTPSPAAPSTGDDQKTTGPKEDTNVTNTSSSTTTETKPTSNPSTDAVPEEMQINIQRLKEMGYSEQSARIALEICANIPDRAVEYLLSDMGGGSDVSFALAAAQQQQQQDGVPAAGTVPVGAGGGSDANPLDFLRNNPVFEDMKRILRDDPAMLPYLMRRMQQSNPDLLSIVAEHQEEFLAMINEGSTAQGPMSRELEDIASAMINSLTPSDMDAIERLKALGYPEHLVIQAYIACERDEYDAAMFLVTQTLDDEE
ncbi:UV excision repair protein RAD23 homolog A-like [Anopheles maculipalpis]|uniref:UV excision repair protein RAD23 homolog A-like n=1 Tax=Anopheles maculipalpis TaxID=1496333 RepID=UPI0021598981|nr:UV excision repair protein RAD23 homolog A-like [Anopheles maculipalpis]